jgi:hypothetical protein
MKDQWKLSVLAQQIKFEPNNEKPWFAYQVALDQVIKAAPA